MGGFAAVGFLLPWLLLGCYGMARHMGAHPSPELLLYLCPSSIISLGLDNASLAGGLMGWLLISATNTVLYAVLGVAVAICVRLWKSN